MDPGENYKYNQSCRIEHVLCSDILSDCAGRPNWSRILPEAKFSNSNLLIHAFAVNKRRFPTADEESILDGIILAVNKISLRAMQIYRAVLERNSFRNKRVFFCERRLKLFSFKIKINHIIERISFRGTLREMF